MLLFEKFSALLSSIDMTLLVSRLFLVFSDNKSKLFDVVVRLDDGGLIFDEIFLGRMIVECSRIPRIPNTFLVFK